MIVFALAILFVVGLALFWIVSEEMRANGRSLIEALREWQSGLGILFGFFGLIMGNLIQYHANAEIKNAEFKREDAQVAIALYADITTRATSLRSLISRRGHLESEIVRLKPEKGWASKKVAAQSVCEIARSFYATFKPHDLGVFESQRANFGKLPSQVSRGYIDFYFGVETVKSWTKDNFACAYDPDFWLTNYANTVSSLLKQATNLENEIFSMDGISTVTPKSR